MNGDADRRRRVTRTASIAAVLALLLVGAWFAWGPGGGVSEDTARGTTIEASDAGPGGWLSAPDRATPGDDGTARRTAVESAKGPASRPRLARAEPTWIVGEVLDDAGAPLPWAHVAIVSTGGFRYKGKDLTIALGQGSHSADAEGRFWRQFFTPKFTVWLQIVDDRVWRSTPIAVTTGDEAFRIIAVRRTHARIRVIDEKGRSLEGASVTIRPLVTSTHMAEQTLDGLHASDWETAIATLDRTDLRTVTNVDGNASCPLPDPRVRMALDVVPSIDREDLLPVHVLPWKAVDEATIVLPVGLPVRGRVVNSKGTSVAAGVVRWTPEGGTTTDAKIAYDGTFELPSQPAGPIRLEAVDESLLRPKESRSTVVAAGTTDVVLVLDTAGELSIRVANRVKGAGGKAYLSVDGEGDASRGTTIAELENDGTATLPGLVDGESYVLWIPAVALDSAGGPVTPTAERTGYVYRRGITVRDSPLVVEEVIGESAELEIASGDRWYPETASIDERGVRSQVDLGWLGFATTRSETGFVNHHRAWFPALPPGEWTVRISGTNVESDDTKPVSIARTVKPGAHLHVDFMPPKDGAK